MANNKQDDTKERNGSEEQVADAEFGEQDQAEIVFIQDEDGNEHEYEVIMYLEPDGMEHKYVILMPVDEDGDSEEAEVVPFRYIEEGDELKLFPLESDEEWQIVGETFYALYHEGEEDEQPAHKE